MSPRPHLQRDPPAIVLLGDTGISEIFCDYTSRLYTSHPKPARMHAYAGFDAMRHTVMWDAIHEIRLVRIRPTMEFVETSQLEWYEALPYDQTSAVVWCIRRNMSDENLFAMRSRILSCIAELDRNIRVGVVIWGDDGPKTRTITQRLSLGVIKRPRPVEVVGIRPSKQADTQNALELFLKWMYCV